MGNCSNFNGFLRKLFKTLAIIRLFWAVLLPRYFHKCVEAVSTLGVKKMADENVMLHIVEVNRRPLHLCGGKVG